MNDLLTREGMKYIISRLIDRAHEAAQESREKPADEFAAGRKVAYYEMLDILKSELTIREQDLKELGIDIDIEKSIA